MMRLRPNRRHARKAFRLRRWLRREEGNALWVSVLLMATMVWVGFVSVRNSTSELKVAGNLREGLLLTQAAEGAMQRVTGLCNLNPNTFDTVIRNVTDAQLVGSPQPMINCDATTNLCDLHPQLTGRSEFHGFNTNYVPSTDPDGRGDYNYTVVAQSHGPPVRLARTEKFCAMKYDVVVEARAPGTGDQPVFAGRTTITVQPVPCGVGR